MMGPVVLVVARARNGVIGLNNQLPWHLPEDLKHFKNTTMGRHVLMGRSTYESIGRPLPGRTILVLTRNTAWQAHGVHPVYSIKQAQEMAGDAPLMIAGGAQIYRLALPIATHAVITQVDLAPDGDAWFSELDNNQWEKTAGLPQQSSNGTRFEIEHWERKAG
jgi:dihydrofolate reductase